MMYRIVIATMLLVVSLEASAQNTEDTLNYHVDYYGVYIDNCIIHGSFYDTDSLIIKIGTTVDAGDLKVFKDLLKIQYGKSGIEGSAFIVSGSKYVIPVAFLSLQGKQQLIKNLSLLIKRGDMLLKEIKK